MPILKLGKFILIFFSATLLAFIASYVTSTFVNPVVNHCKDANLFLLLFTPFILFWLIWRSNSTFTYIWAGLVWGGALSNFLELIQKLCVNDYLSFFDLVYFNLADVFICIGILLLIRTVYK